jgi:general secretion pathway protein B
MSSILEALERAEEERLKGKGQARRPLSAQARGRRINGRLAGLVLGCILLLNLGLWFFYRTTPSALKTIALPQPVQTRSPASRVPPAAVASQHRPNVVRSQPVKPALSVREQLKRSTLPSDKPLISEAVVARAPPLPPPPKARAKAVEPSPAPASAQTRAEAPVIVKANEGVPRAVERSQPPGVIPATPMERTLKPVTAPRPASPQERVTTAPAMDKSPQAGDQIPLVWELPQTLREKVLQLKSSVHVYSETPAERFVIINMHRYSEGDTLPPDGFRLVRIEREGLVIDYGGGLVRLQRR